MFIKRFLIYSIFVFSSVKLLGQENVAVFIKRKLIGFDTNELQYSYKQKHDSLLYWAQVAKHGKDEKGLANCLRRLGIVYDTYGLKDSAIRNYIESAKIASKTGYSLSEASSLNQVGIIYSEFNNHHQALSYFQKALDLYEDLGDERGISLAGLNIADSYYEKGNNLLAEEFCLQSIEASRKWGDTLSIGYNYDLLSRIYSDKNNISKALDYSGTAVFLFKKDQDYLGLLPALFHRANIYNSLKREDTALNLYKVAYQLARMHQSRNWIAESCKQISLHFEKHHAPDSAFFYLVKYNAYKDSLFDQNITTATMNAAIKYDTEKKETELRTQLKLTENSQLLNLALALVVILLLVTILVLIRNSSQRKKIAHKESEIKSVNAMLKGKDDERARIARELHDRVGSMISAVKLHFSVIDEQMSELVKTQHKSNKKIGEMLDETYEEVRRISHNLDPGRISRVGLRIAIMELVQEIEETNKLKVLFIDNGLEPLLYKNYETDIYDITREMLINTIKHARAREASIQLSRNNGNLVYSYEDDGTGFSKEHIEGSQGVGYKNIEARVKRMNGTWHLETSLGNGLNLIIEIPINADTYHHS